MHVGIYNTPESYLPDWLLERAAVLWDEAELVAEDEDVWARVHRSRLQLTYAELRRMPMDDPRRAEKMARFCQRSAGLWYHPPARGARCGKDIVQAGKGRFDLGIMERRISNDPDRYKKSGYRIVVAAGASEAAQYAAQELAKYLMMISGASLPIAEDTCPAQDKEIVIGRTNRPDAPCGCGLKNDGYLLKTVGERLFILGENDRGNLYGVYGLLENHLGCRFLAEGVEKVPSRRSVCLPDLDETVIPPAGIPGNLLARLRALSGSGHQTRL